MYSDSVERFAGFGLGKRGLMEFVFSLSRAGPFPMSGTTCGPGIPCSEAHGSLLSKTPILKGVIK